MRRWTASPRFARKVPESDAAGALPAAESTIRLADARYLSQAPVVSDAGYDYDLLVIGSGPGGQKAAIAAAKLGHRVAVVDVAHMVGGVCVNTGTIPSQDAARGGPLPHRDAPARAVRRELPGQGRHHDRRPDSPHAARHRPRGRGGPHPAAAQPHRAAHRHGPLHRPAHRRSTAPTAATRSTVTARATSSRHRAPARRGPRRSSSTSAAVMDSDGILSLEDDPSTRWSWWAPV